MYFFFQNPKRGAWPAELFHWQTGPTCRGPGRTWAPCQLLAPLLWPLVSGRAESRWRCRLFRRLPPLVRSWAELASALAATPARRSCSGLTGTLQTHAHVHFTSCSIIGCFGISPSLHIPYVWLCVFSKAVIDCFSKILANFITSTTWQLQIKIFVQGETRGAHTDYHFIWLRRACDSLSWAASSLTL